MRQDCIGRQVHQFCRGRLCAIRITGIPTNVDLKVAALYPTQFPQALDESGNLSPDDIPNSTPIRRIFSDF
jgi:hypothetical protein